MVQQYNQNNINSPRGSELFDADADLDLDNDMVVVTTVDGPVTLTLPTAVQIPGQELAIKADDAGSTGNAVTLVPLAGQDIDGDASLELTEDQESVCLKSDGSNWRVVCGGGGGATGATGCCAPVIASWIRMDPEGSPSISPDPDAAPINEGIPCTAIIVPFPEPPATLDVEIPVLKMDDPNDGGGASVVVRDIPNQNDTNITVSGTALQDLAPNFSILTVTLNTENALNDSQGDLILTNDCGCCAVVAIIVPDVS